MANPRSRAFPAFWSAVFAPNGPYGRDAAGTMETVGSLARDDVAAFHAARFAPSRATLVITGDLGDVDAASMAADAFDSWTAEPAAAEVTEPVARATPTAVTLIDRPGSVQSNLLIGQAGVPRASGDHLALDLVMEVLGGMFNSRLNLLLREQKGYSYGVGGASDPLRHGGFAMITSAVQTPHTAESVADIVDGLRAMAERGVTVTELGDARDYQLGVFPLRNETPQQIASLIGTLAVYGLPDETYDVERERLRALSTDEVDAVAARVLRPDALAVVVVGDAEQIELRDAGFGPVTVVSDG